MFLSGYFLLNRRLKKIRSDILQHFSQLLSGIILCKETFRQIMQKREKWSKIVLMRKKTLQIKMKGVII